MAEQVTNYQCPACTGPLHFAGSSGRMECEYCGSSFSVEEIEAMYQDANAKAEEGLEVWEKSNEEWQDDDMKSYSCPSCGAGIMCDDNTAATSCPYCGNPSIVPGKFAGELKPDFVIPFKYEKKQAIEKLKEHYKGKPLLPKNFKDSNHIDEIQGVYVPFWLYDGYASGKMTFEGFQKTVKETPTKKITTTKHFNVERSGGVSFEKIPADASSKMPDDLMDSIEPYNYDELKPFTKAYLTGYVADKYDVSAEDDAARAVGRAKASAISALRADAMKSYDSVDDKTCDIHVEQGKVSYAMLPVWLLNTKYNDKQYYFAMNGQTGNLVGDLPSDNGKLTLYSILAFILGALLGIILLETGLFGTIVMGIVVAAVIDFILISMMKSVAHATEANKYVTQGGIKIHDRVDIYTHTTEEVESKSN